ncbi:MAG: site-specific DNA-methyltransferase [Anaerolineales bacterium]
MTSPLQESLFDLEDITLLTARRKNILRSPKQYGNADDDARPYLAELGVELTPAPQSIQFQPNANEAIHRWSPYVQGFSSSFVQRTLERYSQEYQHPVIMDPFAGSGTVLVQAKLNGYPSYGIELNPLLHFIATTKVSFWDVSPQKVLAIASHLYQADVGADAPTFLKSQIHFRPQVLKHLQRLKGGLDVFEPKNDEEKAVKNLLLLAFASILVDSSNLKRSPCLGYSPTKVVEDDAPLRLFAQKVEQIVEDLRLCQSRYRACISTPAKVLLGNSMDIEIPERCDLIITSPPYMNGLDYVMNYKIEMGWLGFGQNHRELKHIKDQMVVCDNVSKDLIRRFEQSQRYTHPWIERIKEEIQDNIKKRGNYRRQDMPEIVHKYFDDMYRVMKHVSRFLNRGGRFVLVVGDSLIADVYVPTDIILAHIGQEFGLHIEALEKALQRRSGQIRSYRLRETIVVLRKD